MTEVDLFIQEMTEWFLSNPMSKAELEQLRTQSTCVPFSSRYDPKLDPEKEEQRRKKISNTMKSRPQSAASLKNLENNRYWAGKKQPPEMIKNRSAALMGRQVSDTTRQKISEKNKGNKNMLGKKHSEETKQKMRESAKNRKKGSIQT